MARIPIIYNLRSLKIRIVSTFVAVICIAGVVGVFIATLSIANGFRETLRASGSEDNVMVRRGGSSSEMESAVTLEQAKIMADAAGVARDEKGNPIYSAEVVVIAALPLRSSGTDANVQVRGLSDMVLKVRENVRIKQGRFFKPGLPELVVGSNAKDLYINLDLHDTIQFGGRTWTVVGIMDSGKTAFDSEIWCDANVLNQTYKRPTYIFQSVTLKLASIDRFNDFKDALTADPRLTVEVEKEIDYYKGQSKIIVTLIEVLGFLVAIVMGIGAIFGALNTMYAAVSARSKEIAALRALGFSKGNVITSFVLESLVIAVIGGILGCIAVLPLNGFTASTMNWASFSYLAFAFAVTPDLMIKGIFFALLMGFFGGLFPALRAARQPIPTALRGL